MPKSEIEDHVIEVFKSTYSEIVAKANIYQVSSEIRVVAAEAAVKLTQIIIEAERDQR